MIAVLNRRTAPVLVLATLLAGVAAPAAGQGDRGNAGWYIRATPYLWFSNLSGVETLAIGEADAIIGGFVVPVGDTVLATDWGARLELGKGRVRALINFKRASVANTREIHPVGDPTTSVPAAFVFDWLSTDVFGAVQIGPFTENRAVEIYGGIRYVRLRHELNAPGTITSDVVETWIEPVIGGRLYSEMGGRFWAMFDGDLGGFGVGSQFMLTVGAELGFRVAKPLDLMMRYSYHELDYDSGRTGASAFAWQNGAIQGWFFGAVLKY